VARLLGNAATPPIQRVLDYDPAQLEAIAPPGGLLGAVVAAKDPHRAYRTIIRLLKDYQRAPGDHKEKWRQLNVLRDAVAMWLNDTPASDDKADRRRRDEMQLLFDKASVERSRLEGLKVVGEDMSAGRFSAMSDQAKNFALPQAKALAEGRAGNTPGAREPALELAMKYGLTQGELAALKAFTTSDYQYMNPAVANSDDWLKKQNPQHVHEGKEQQDLKKLKQRARSRPQLSSRRFSSCHPSKQKPSAAHA
jgi:hypothetical protein